MKQWIAVTLLGFALVAAWRLPPEPAEYRTVSDRTGDVTTAEEMRYRALRNEQRVTAEVLRRTLWSDSLSQRVVEDAEDGVAVLAPAGGDGTREQLDRFGSVLREQVARRASHGQRTSPSRQRTSPSSSMVFGFVFQPRDQSAEEPIAFGRDRTETYVGTRDGVGYCLQVRVAHPQYLGTVIARRLVDGDGAPPFTDHLGPCRFYLTYGMAGSGVQDWLASGAVELGVERADGGAPAAMEVPASLRGRRGPLGFTSFVGYGQSLEVTRCLAGIAASCGAFLENRGGAYFLTEAQLDIARRSPVTGMGSHYGSGRWFGDQAYLLADLEAEFGPRAFEAFWTSDAPMPEAFEAAFGVDTGTWMVRWVDRNVGVDRPGPGLPREASTGAVLTVGLLVGMAWWRRRNRDVAA